MPRPVQKSPDAAASYAVDLTEKDRRFPSFDHSDSDRRHSSTMGLAVTSNSDYDGRGRLPSQRDNPDAWKRSSGSVADAYADLIGKGCSIDESLQGRKPGDRSSMASQTDRPKRKTWRYYEDKVQQESSARNGSRDKVHKQSPIIAELKTNVIIKDEFTLVTDLSHHLAQRYTRPNSCIMIKVDHSACLALGGSFEPCYILTINAVTYQMGPTTNKRNAGLMQAFIADILSVPAERGIVKFEAIAEENLAMNGNTMLGEIEKLENATEEPNLFQRTARRSMPAMSRKSMSRLNSVESSVDIPDVPNGVRRGPSQSPPPNPGRGTANPSPDLFELPSTEARKGQAQQDRPATFNGNFAAENGLRMNGISAEQLTHQNGRLLNGRPKTLGSAPSQESVHRHRSEHIARQTTPRNGSTSTLPSQRNKHNSRSFTAPGSAKSSMRPKSTAAAPPQSDPRARNVYLDNMSTLTSKGTPLPQHQKPPVSKHQPPPSAIPAWTDNDGPPRLTLSPTPTQEEKGNQDYGRERQSFDAKDRGANTAKRRSTLTATPMIPLSEGGKETTSTPKASMSHARDSRMVGPPPPVPAPNHRASVDEKGPETRSLGGKAGRRRSFWRKMVGKDGVA